MGFKRQMLTIPASGRESDSVELSVLERCLSLSIQGPTALTGTVTVQSADAEDGSRYTNVQSPPGTAVTCPANAAVVLTETPFPRLRLQSSVAEAAERKFIVWLDLKD